MRPTLSAKKYRKRAWSFFRAGPASPGIRFKLWTPLRPPCSTAQNNAAPRPPPARHVRAATQAALSPQAPRHEPAFPAAALSPGPVSQAGQTHHDFSKRGVTIARPCTLLKYSVWGLCSKGTASGRAGQARRLSRASAPATLPLSYLLTLIVWCVCPGPVSAVTPARVPVCPIMGQISKPGSCVFRSA